MCRDTLTGFLDVSAELGLSAQPVSPPELLWPRIRRDLGERSPERRRRASMIAMAASVAALVGMAGLSVSLGSRANRAESARDRMAQVVDALSQPGTATRPLQARTSPASPMVEVTGPTLERVLIVGRDIPQPRPGFRYQLWLVSGQTYRPVRAFVPDGLGFVFLRCAFDPSQWQGLLVTEERAGAPPSTPSLASPHVWGTSF